MITYKQLFITKFNLKGAVAQYLIYIFILGRTDFHSPLSSFLSWHSKYKNMYFGCTVIIEMHMRDSFVAWFAVFFFFSLLPSLTYKMVHDFGIVIK